MPLREQRLYGTFGHNRIEASFVGRLFVIYEAKGRGKMPVVLTTVKVDDFGVDLKTGPWAKVSEQKTERVRWLRLSLGYCSVIQC
jgi:hypothetical protein